MILVLMTAPLTVPIGLIVALALKLREGGPVLYLGARVGQGGRPFRAYKFRTMRHSDEDGGVSGGDKSARISEFSAVLRRTRLDELPQLLNVLRGDMSLVGPRPPDPRYVDMFPDLYGRVLQSRPGLTGLATLYMHRFEDRVLRETTTAAQTEAVYVRRCIPRKARLDLMYQARQSKPGAICLDIGIILRSARSVLR